MSNKDNSGWNVQAGINTVFGSLSVSKHISGPSIKVEIISPSDGEHCHHKVEMYGTVSNLPKDMELWVVKKILKPDKYHPDNGPIKINGKDWYASAYIGNRKHGADHGKSYKILIVAASISTGRTYASYVNNAKIDNDYHGMADLDDGKEVASVSVIRDDR